MGGKRKYSERGFALPLVLIFTLVLTITGMGFLYMGGQERVLTEKKTESGAAFYVGEAGIERGVAYLQAQSPPLGGTEAYDHLDLFQEDSTDLGEGSYQTTIDPDDGNLGRHLKKYHITSIGQAGSSNVNVKKQVEVEVQTENFAKFCYCTDEEIHPKYHKIWFFDKDVLEGPVHSNSQFHMSGSPTFKGEVTSSADSIDYYHGGPPRDNPDFQAGLSLGVDKKNMGKYMHLGRLKSAANSGGLVLEGDTSIIFDEEKIKVKKAKEKKFTEMDLGSNFNGVVYIKDGGLTVSGTLEGQFTLVADEDIWIPDDLVYDTHDLVRGSPPGPDDDNYDLYYRDMLGLVSGGDVVISKHAPNDLEIDATIMALDTSFMVEHFRSKHKGVLSVYGGIIQKYRGPVGTFDAHKGKKVSGYKKDYHYDERMRNLCPPFYPTTGVYDLVSWKEVPWKEVPVEGE